MNKQMYSKKIVLIPSAYNAKVMGDIASFINYYQNDFELYVIYDQKSKKEKNITYINKKDSYAKYLKLTADYIIDAGSINGETKICQSQKRISVWHGIPYKKMFIALDKSTITDALTYNYGVDTMVSPSNFYSDEFLRKSMLYDGNILETSISRTDSLYLNDQEKEKIKAQLGIRKNKKILLYAPTYRKKGKISLPFNPNLLLEKLNKLNVGEWTIVTKMHYLNTLTKTKGIVDCTNYSNVNNLLAISDLLITDYSSLFFDYSILNKPAVFYQYDKEQYDSKRGFMFELENYVDKKYIVTTETQLLEVISKVINKANLSKVKKYFYPHQIPNSTAKLVKELNFNSEKRATKDIIFLVNDLNQIGGVHSFILNLASQFKKDYNSRIFVFGIKEFASTNTELHRFDSENIIDIKLSKEKDEAFIECILKNTNAFIISCQFMAHKTFQNSLKNKNAILMFHGDTKDIINMTVYKWHLKYLNSQQIGNYKKILLLTESNMQLLATKIKSKLKPRLDYMNNSIDFSKCKNLYKKSKEFVFISRLDEDKNIFDLIKIFSSKKLNDNYRVHVYGDGKLRQEFINQIKEKNLTKKIIFHGYCNDKEEMYGNKQGLIMTSLTEGFAIIILEAAKYGIPIYLYDSFTSVEEFKKYKVIKCTPPGDIDKFVNNLNKAIEVKQEYFEKIINEYSNEKISIKWKKIFDEIYHEKSVALHFNIRFFIKKSIFQLISKGSKIIEKIIKKDKTNFIKRMSNLKIIFDNLLFKIKKIFKKKYHPLVSLIVPFYNNISTIDKCLKSIEKSGYLNYEIIVINDGSKQNPEKICNKYHNVKYFYKDNEGPGLTRNYGISKANGKFIFFLDSDDTICKGAMNFLVDYALKKNLKMVSGVCRKIEYNTKKVSFWKIRMYLKNYVNNKENRYKILEDTISTCKLYDLEELKKSAILFEKGLYEDKLFMSQIYQYYDKIGIINKFVYNWYNYGQNTSITTNISYENIHERIEKIKKIFSLIEDKYKQYYIKIIIAHDLRLFVNKYLKYSKTDQYKVYQEFKEIILEEKKFVYEKLIEKFEYKELLKTILEDNFERFDIISICISMNKQR